MNDLQREPISVLFLCMGNICRSPMAEGIFLDIARKTNLANDFHIDSAGTGAWHEGDLPDPRAIKTLMAYDIDISDQRSRPINSADFDQFDLILAMDHRNLRDLAGRFSADQLSTTHLFMQYSLQQNVEVPDPYMGSEDGFENVYRMLLEGCTSLLEKLQSE